MIKRIEAGGGDTHPFPQRQLPDTVAYIENGTTVIINCVALKDLLIAKDVDVTAHFTTSSVETDTGGVIHIGADEYDEMVLYLESYVYDGKVWIYSHTNSVENEPIEATTDMTIADVLDAFGTQTIVFSDIIGGFNADFAFLEVSDLDNGSQEIEINADEAVSFLTVTAP